MKVPQHITNIHSLVDASAAIREIVRLLGDVPDRKEVTRMIRTSSSGGLGGGSEERLNLEPLPVNLPDDVGVIGNPIIRRAGD